MTYILNIHTENAVPLTKLIFYAIEGIIFSISQSTHLIDPTNDNHSPSASFKLPFKGISTLQLHYATVTKATNMGSRQKLCLFTLKYSPARKTLQNDVYQKLHICMQEIYMKELWRRGKYMLYFDFFLLENTFMFVE